MEHVEMVVINAVRYRKPDAERLGLVVPTVKAGSTKPKTGAVTKPKRATSTKTTE